MPEKTSQALDAMEQTKLDRFPYAFCDHVLKNEQRLFDGFMALLGKDVDDVVRGRLWDFMQGQGDSDGLRTRLMKALEELVEERRTYKKRKDQLDARRAVVAQRPQDEATQHEIDSLLRERDKMLELIKEINGRDLLASSPLPVRTMCWRSRSVANLRGLLIRAVPRSWARESEMLETFSRRRAGTSSYDESAGRT